MPYKKDEWELILKKGRKVGNMAEKDIKVNDHSDPVTVLKATIACTDDTDDSSKSFRNGLRYAIYILTGEKQHYEI